MCFLDRLIDRAVLVLVSLLLLLAAGCTPVSSTYTPPQVEDAHNKGRLSLFVNLLETDGPDLSMQITGAELFTEDGRVYSHVIDSPALESSRIGSGQVFFARMALEPRKYTRLKLIVGEAGEVNSGSTQLLPLGAAEFSVNLHTPLDVAVGDSKSFFLTWDTKKSVKENKFYPVLELAPRLKKLIADVGYVACPEIDTVFMFSTKENRVIDSLGIPAGPSYLFQSPHARDDEVFALGEKAPRVFGFSPETNGITTRYNLSTLTRPVHMALSPSGRWAYILDRHLGTISRFDLTSGIIRNQVRLNYDPMYILYLERFNLLAVSLSLSQNVVLLNPETLQQQHAISTGSRPDGLLLVDDRILYIAESGINSLMAYDLENNQVVKRVQVGYQPTRVSRTSNYLYVVNRGSSSLSAFRRGLLTMSRDIPVPGTPLEMAFSNNNNHVYVGNRREMALEVLNPITNVFSGRIELGAVPRGILILQ